MHELLTSERIAPKPIPLMETDGAQDEAPCNPKPLVVEISLFKELKLDALLHGINPSGMSAYILWKDKWPHFRMTYRELYFPMITLEFI